MVIIVIENINRCMKYVLSKNKEKLNQHRINIKILGFRKNEKMFSGRHELLTKMIMIKKKNTIIQGVSDKHENKETI